MDQRRLMDIYQSVSRSADDLHYPAQLADKREMLRRLSRLCTDVIGPAIEELSTAKEV